MVLLLIRSAPAGGSWLATDCSGEFREAIPPSRRLDELISGDRAYVEADRQDGRWAFQHVVKSCEACVD